MLFTSQTLLIVSTLLLKVLAITPNQLNIQLNKELLDKHGQAVFGSIVQINGVDKWTEDGRYVDIAEKAFAGMSTAFDEAQSLRGRKKGQPAQLGSSNLKEKPTVMTIVVVQDHVVISSSMRGDGPLFTKFTPTMPDPPPASKDRQYWSQANKGMCPSSIYNGLKQCEVTLPEPSSQVAGHRNGGSCGEVMAAWALCDILGDRHLNGAKVVAVQMDKKTGAITIVDPCGADSGQWKQGGCAAFNKAFGWHAIPVGTTAVDAGQVTIQSVQHASYLVKPVVASHARDWIQ